MSRPAPQHQGDALDVPDEASVSSSDAGSESPTGAGRRGGALRTQSAEMMAVADAMANVAEVRLVLLLLSKYCFAVNMRSFDYTYRERAKTQCRTRKQYPGSRSAV